MELTDLPSLPANADAKVLVRFLAKLKVSTERFYNSTPCWEWQASLVRKGYGQFGIGHSVWRSHRVSYLLFKGHPGKLHVLHYCDNPSCCNPDHLWLGTNADNVRDMHAKGRANKARGDRCGARAKPECLKVKIPKAEIPTIIRLRREGKRLRYIAQLYGVHRTTIGMIVRGKSRVAAARQVA